jgi:hypothetical protein
MECGGVERLNVGRESIAQILRHGLLAGCCARNREQMREEARHRDEQLRGEGKQLIEGSNNVWGCHNPDKSKTGNDEMRFEQLFQNAWRHARRRWRASC